MTQHLTIHASLPGLNELIEARMVRSRGRGAKGKRWNAYSALKREWMGVLVPLARAQLKPVERVHVRIHYFEANRRRDLDNISAGARKFILDALVEAGILANDGWRHVEGFTEQFHISNAPRVDVFLEECGDTTKKAPPKRGMR